MRQHDEIPIADDVPAEFRLDSYRYNLPEERIARRPAEKRDGSRLLLLDREGDTRAENFADLPELLAAKFPEGGLLVANNSRVFPARVFGHRATGGKVEMLLLSPLPLLHVKPAAGGSNDCCSNTAATATAEVEALLRSAKRMKPGEAAEFGEGLRAVLLERGDFGRCRVRLEWQGSLLDIMNKIGHMPLPPYLEREDDATDRERYQTTYADASKAGSVAAPTAGLHFTPEVRERLRAKGFDWAEVTLYVGYGTFSPVREGDIRRHEMHGEYVEVPEQTAQAVHKAKEQGRPVIAVGTTSARSLEGMHRALGNVAPFAGETKIYIIPGSRFDVVDALLTNFHLPESSLLIMVSALAGRERIMAAYAMALDRGFRFFSYGDAMLIV